MRASTVGIEKIKAERLRQIHGEGWSEEHDDQHDDGSLTAAAKTYAAIAFAQIATGTDALDSLLSPGIQRQWPWELHWLKPDNDPIRNLEKAGALIAAEIDRLTRAQATAGGTTE